MKVTAQFHNWPNLAHPFPEDVQHFRSLRQAVDVFRRRVAGYDTRYPTVTDTATFWIVWGHLDAMPDYPDRIVSVGPRGGVKARRV